MFKKNINNPSSVMLVQQYQTYIDMGLRFVAGTSNAALAAGATLSLLIKGNGKKIKFVHCYTATGEVECNVFKNPTITVNGTALTPVNRNLTSANVLANAVYGNPTVSANGTSISVSSYTGASSIGQTTSGGSAIAIDEYLTQTDDIYITLKNNSASAIKASISVNISREDM